MKPIDPDALKEFFMGSGPDEILDKIGALPGIHKRFVCIGDWNRCEAILAKVQPKTPPTLKELVEVVEGFIDLPFAHPEEEKRRHVFFGAFIGNKELEYVRIFFESILHALKRIEKKDFESNESKTFATDLMTFCKYGMYCEKQEVEVNYAGVTVKYGSPKVGLSVLTDPREIVYELFGATPSLEQFYDFVISHVNIKMQDDTFDPGWDKLVDDLAEEIKKL